MFALVLLLTADVDTAKLAQEVRATEIAFAKAFADRKLDDFIAFVSDDAVFVGNNVSRGKAGVRDAWKKMFEGAAPFSWQPDKVEVTASGVLGLSSGPVFDPSGKRFGTFNSTWRLENGKWRIVLDIGCPSCECGEKK